MSSLRGMCYRFINEVSLYFSRPAEVLYGESSMRNGFGLRLLHKFLGLPFLRLQKVTLQSLMERNERDTEVCSFELTEFLVITSRFSKSIILTIFLSEI